MSLMAGSVGNDRSGKPAVPDVGSFLAPAIVGFMLAAGRGAYVLHTFALTSLIAALALIAIGTETKGKVLEEVTAAEEAGKEALAPAE